MAEDKLGTNARRRARRNARAVRERSQSGAAGVSGGVQDPVGRIGYRDSSLAIDLDYLGRTYGMDIVDFAEVDWSNGAPKLRMRGRKRE